ncbi:MAG TPA: hypothetical protein VHO26_06275 [Propionibacteriaceae bacterium]|nr:hypothetical protein [Propionibacteriaceae bacterium]
MTYVEHELADIMRDGFDTQTVPQLEPVTSGMLADALAAHEPPDDGDDGDDGLTIEDRVFTATHTLATIRQAAHARLVTPWAVLGATLARIVAEVPPHVVLPPLVGSDASLNLAVALVADSGGGKSGASGCAADAVTILGRRAHDIGPGSGEGIMQEFLEYDDQEKCNVLRANPLALLQADEIGQIGAVQGRSSQASFGPIIRSMLTGDMVATSAVDAARKRHLPANTYRLAVVAGVQPRLASILLDDTDAGTPQRWVWMPASDPEWDVPDTPWPAPVRWSLPIPPRGGTADGRVRIEVPDATVRAVKQARVRKLRGEGEALDGHRLLAREKVAAALAILHGGYTITEQWWHLAGQVMAVSDVTRDRCLTALGDSAAKAAKARGRLDAEREAGAREARDEQLSRYAALIWRTVATKGHSNAKHEPDAGCTTRCLSFALRNHKGADREAAVALAAQLEWIEEREGHWFPGCSQPNELGGAA